MIKKEIKVGSFSQSESKDYSDILDREIARSFLYQYKQFIPIRFGGTFDLDLVSDTQAGCDVEFLTFNAVLSFKNDNGFRIPKRKEHYWSGNNFRAGKNGPWKNTYQYWDVDYIQLFGDRDNLLYYKSEVIKEHFQNVIYRDIPGWDEKNRYFIQIPYNKGKDVVEHWVRDINGLWNKTKIN
jgi:hypothetical protein